MALSKKLQILNALKAHLIGITPANPNVAAGEPYEHDLSKAVFIGRTVFGDSDPKPLLAILERPVPPDAIDVAGEEKRMRQEDWVLLLQGFAPDDTLNPTVPAYTLLAEVEERLGQIMKIGSQGQPDFPAVHMLGNLIAGLTIGPGVVRPPTKDISATAFFYLPVAVRMTTDVTNPYAA